MELSLLWVEALNSHALLKKRIYYLCGKNFYTIALNPLMCLDIWHTRTIWNKFHFTCILNKLFHVALLSIYIFTSPYHPLKYSYDFPNYDLILFKCVLYNILSCSRQNFTRGTNDDTKKGISIETLKVNIEGKLHLRVESVLLKLMILLSSVETLQYV